MRLSQLVLLFAAAVTLLVSAVEGRTQLAPPTPKTVIAPRMPALSPDGSRLAFVYRGDVWIADAAGGRATPLTRNVEMDAYPQFSPDGNWISFSSQRTGNWDIFVVPAAGGEPQRMTWHSGADISYGWSPDGKRLLFTARRETGDSEMLTLDVKTLRLHKLAQDYVGMATANFAPDGRTVVYGHFDSFPWTRPRYHGSAATQICLLDVATGKSHTITDDQKQHLGTRFLPDGKRLITVTYAELTPSSHKLDTKPEKFVDNAARTPNLWQFDLAGHGKQLTQFVGGSVRFPTVAARTGDIAFEYGQDLWMLKNGAKTPTRIVLTAAEDDAQSTFRHETLTNGVTEAEPSPDGKTFAFGLRGDIWTVPIDRPKGVAAKGMEIARRLTDWPGDDSDFLWSQDGKKLYYRSDREYVTRLYEMDLSTLAIRPLWTRKEDVGQLHMSPDGKELAFWIRGTEGGLYLLALDTGQARRLIPMPDAAHEWQEGADFTWSPDRKWYAFTAREMGGPVNIWILAASGGAPVNVTRLNAWHGMPTWTPDGKYLLFSSDRDGAGLYMLPLTREQARIAETDLKFEKPKGAVTVSIDFDQITRRIRKVTGQSPQGDLTVTSEGAILFLSEGDIWSISYDGSDLKRLTGGGGCSSLRISKDSKHLFFIRNGELWVMKTEAGNAQEKATFAADFDHDIHAERKAAFAQFWNAFNRNFYDSNMHGRDWEAIRKRYEPMLDGVETRVEFATLLQMMVGELESSHSEVGPAPGGNPSPTTPHLGFTFDYAYEGPGIRVDKVPQGSPASFPQTLIKPGEYVLAIDGHDVTLDENLYRTINDKQGRMMEFLVNAKPTKQGARTVKYASLTGGEYGALLYANRVERARAYVEQKSGGALSYVHIAGMGGGNQVTFERELYEYSIGKKGIIIDVRHNGGGNISDTLVNWLTTRQHGFYVPRDGLAEPAPGRVWNKPIIVLMAESSFSNAEMFPYAMKARGLARLVGEPTPGYVIWTGGLPLVDGTNARMPGSGVYRQDGSPMEDLGEMPDVRVPLTAEDWLADRDPQLDKAIEMLMK
jgi:Tol biopolymer transport system component/C-terminal processing protease CtpA/Prc